MDNASGRRWRTRRGVLVWLHSRRSRAFSLIFATPCRPLWSTLRAATASRSLVWISLFRLHRNRALYAYYVRRCDEALPGQYVIFGHVGDANVHVNLLPRYSLASENKPKTSCSIPRKYVVSSRAGTVAAEHWHR